MNWKSKEQSQFIINAVEFGTWFSMLYFCILGRKRSILSLIWGSMYMMEMHYNKTNLPAILSELIVWKGFEICTDLLYNAHNLSTLSHWNLTCVYSCKDIDVVLEFCFGWGFYALFCFFFFSFFMLFIFRFFFGSNPGTLSFSLRPPSILQVTP